MDRIYKVYGYEFAKKKMTALEELAASLHSDISYEEAVQMIKDRFDCIPSKVIRQNDTLVLPHVDVDLKMYRGSNTITDEMFKENRFVGVHRTPYFIVTNGEYNILVPMPIDVAKDGKGGYVGASTLHTATYVCHFKLKKDDHKKNFLSHKIPDIVDDLLDIERELGKSIDMVDFGTVPFDFKMFKEKCMFSLAG